MNQEINNLLNTALDSSLSSYYRKDALNKLGRLKKSVELSSAVMKLLADIDDESLQKEAMDLAVKFAIAEAVNVIIPIGAGNSRNARHALSVLAKIGGKQAYDQLKTLADAPGFDLTKNAASRALHDLLCREPDLEEKDKEVAVEATEPEASGVIPEVVVPIEAVAPVAIENTKSVDEIQPQEDRVGLLVKEVAQKQQELLQAKMEIEKLKTELFKAKNKQAAPVAPTPDREAEQENHKLRQELSQVKGRYQEKFSEMSLEISDLKDDLSAAGRLARLNAMQAPRSAMLKGCFGFMMALFFLIFFIIMFIR